MQRRSIILKKFRIVLEIKRSPSKSSNPSQKHYKESNTPTLTHGKIWQTHLAISLWWRFKESEQNWTVRILNQSRFQGCQWKKIYFFLSNPCQRMMSGNWSRNHQINSAAVTQFQHGSWRNASILFFQYQHFLWTNPFKLDTSLRSGKRPKQTSFE